VTGPAPPPAWQLEVAGEPAALRPAAARAAAAAVELGVAAERRADLVLAVHEVLANAWEHGHGGAPTPRIRVEVVRGDDGAVTVHVADRAVGGGWHPDVHGMPADPGAERGRRLVIARALVDELAVAVDEPGTVVSLTIGRRHHAR
jgi:anti-sigma regulatory factor (Ser/Thr protein kinase)